MSARRVGVDTGGTFTDLVERVDGGLRVRKVPSTPHDPGAAILAGLEALGGAVTEIVHGSTVATNALLERRGARAVLLVTAGFEDLLRIGRQARADIYDLQVQAVPPLVERADTIGVRERVAADGAVVVELEDDEISRVVEAVETRDAAAVAICLLHSYANPEHERRLAEALSGRGLFVTASSELLPEFREYERASTTAVNAYVGPVMSAYLGRLEQECEAERLRILQSNGGAMAASVAGDQAVHTVLSGPAGGVVGAFAVASAAGRERIVSFDMGGTSTDVSLCNGRPATTGEASIAGHPIRVPVLDIHTVGAGGGSVAWIDAGGALRVGPRSAGATPGPACYGNGGEEATVTDADLVLGRLAADHFLGGERTLDVAAAESAIDRVATRLGLSRTATAEGIVRVADATMEGAVRVISVERGHDPRDFTLVCFGGAGGMHAVSLAVGLRMPGVLVPRAPGVLSAIGMLRADASRFLSRTVLGQSLMNDRERIESVYSELEATLGADPLLGGSGTRFERSVDLRYRGQGFELEIPWQEDPARAFHAAHRERYGYADESRSVEAVNVRVRGVSPSPAEPTRFVEPGDSDPSAALLDRRPLHHEGAEHTAACYDRDLLAPGNRLHGPALVVEYSSTTFLPPAWSGSVDGHGNLLLEPVSR